MENAITQTNTQSPTMSLPSLLLRLEGLAVFIAAIAATIHLNGNGWLFALLLLAPDLSALGYLKDTRTGATLYNIVHSYTLPGAMLAGALAANWETGVLLVVIWFAHIGMDRVFGYGLKYSTEFKDTHLGRV
jgi:hypothetical protein